MFPSPVEGFCEKPAFNNLFIESVGMHSRIENVLILVKHSIIIIIIRRSLFLIHSEKFLLSQAILDAELFPVMSKLKRLFVQL